MITDYSQVALLLHSVGEWVSKPYLDAFIGAGISGPLRAGRFEPRDASEPGFPAGQVVVTTIHQGKGLEWPVVIVGSLDFDSPRVDPVGRCAAALLPAERLRADPSDRRLRPPAGALCRANATAASTGAHRQPGPTAPLPSHLGRTAPLGRPDEGSRWSVLAASASLR